LVVVGEPHQFELLMDEAGDVSLDDTVGSLLPELDVPNADRVTLEMLANNTSGYPDYVRTDEFVDEFLDDPFAEFGPDQLIGIGMSLRPGTSQGPVGATPTRTT
jgi:D-alanyl-D-alanine carboxypeptidase